MHRLPKQKNAVDQWNSLYLQYEQFQYHNTSQISKTDLIVFIDINFNTWFLNTRRIEHRAFFS